MLTYFIKNLTISLCSLKTDILAYFIKILTIFLYSPGTFQKKSKFLFIFTKTEFSKYFLYLP